MKKIILAVAAFIVVAIIVLNISFTGHVTIQWAKPEQMLRTIVTCVLIAWSFYCGYKTGKKQPKDE